MQPVNQSHCKVTITATVLIATTLLMIAYSIVSAAENSLPRVEFKLNTGTLGGVAVTSDDLAAMQRGPYVLLARAGTLTKVAAEKAKLPRCPRGHCQGANVIKLADGTLYVRQPTIICKSSDGGRTWDSHPLAPIEGVPQDYDRFDATKNPPPPASGKGNFQVLNDGTFLQVSMRMGKQAKGPFTVWNSLDEGRSWTKLAEVPVDVPWDYTTRYSHWGLSRLPDDTLFFGMDLRQDLKYAGAPKTSPITSGTTRLTLFRSVDGGQTWKGPIVLSDWAAEGGICRLPGGNLLASIRYQRPLLATDPPGLLQRWDLQMHNGRQSKAPYKHLFVAESSDGGFTWTDHRQLATVFGQCYGYPVALRDGTVVVVHDTRYGPGPTSGRAMISFDQGQTWEDETYYLYHGLVEASYNQSVVLDDQTILTVGGVLDHLPPNTPGHVGAVGNSDFWAIRWKLQ